MRCCHGHVWVHANVNICKQAGAGSTDAHMVAIAHAFHAHGNVAHLVIQTGWSAVQKPVDGADAQLNANIRHDCRNPQRRH
ncbi:hypothetical protein SDC9_107651 [bioreactor metagenome]|uniref:Uncharacterized protein n=1 Tax=bioreactor metagenome TaxID=1076179 RepID=A0A645B5X0_9ZZZZ